MITKVLGVFTGYIYPIKVWHKWPFLISLAMILGHRERLRDNNLISTERVEKTHPGLDGFDIHTHRTPDGSHNDMRHPTMGMAGARFARNMPIEKTFGETSPDLFEPNPREISNRLLARKDFVAVPHLNLLAAAWIQFMVHDWLSHGANRRDVPAYDIPLPDGDDWPVDKMTVLPTTPDPNKTPEDDGKPEVYTNIRSSWWDGSQLYGSSIGRQALIRTDPKTKKFVAGGKIYLMADKSLPLEAVKSRGAVKQIELTGVNDNWWIGLSVLHRIFANEHNSIVTALKSAYPAAEDDWLFQKGRLINSALMAKIHTVEWTPALMDSSIGRMAMRGNFWGVMGETFNRKFGRIGKGEVLSGIPGSPVDHHGAPFAMTEEFAAVYRLHSLLPDHLSFRDHTNDTVIMETDLTHVSGEGSTIINKAVKFADVLYSLATSNPGALTLHNYPNTLRRINKDGNADGVFLDLAAIDILRDRERGVPRYCEFRRQTDMIAPKTFADMTDDPEWQKELEDVYGDVEKVDLLVGTLAESHAKKRGTPVGFGFSDTAFRIFIVMASRRLKSDRFFTDDFTPDVYTPLGFKWIQDNNMKTVVKRQCPELGQYFSDNRNMFFPWAKGRPHS